MDRERNSFNTEHAVPDQCNCFSVENSPSLPAEKTGFLLAPQHILQNVYKYLPTELILSILQAHIEMSGAQTSFPEVSYVIYIMLQSILKQY